MGKQSSSLLTVQTVRVLVSPAAQANTVGGVEWKRDGSVSVGTIKVRTVVDRLTEGRIVVTVRHLNPSLVTMAYVIDNAAVRRVCINQPHRPFVDAHVHQINPPSEDEVALPAEGYPVVPRSPSVAPGIYREILETFATQCCVTLADDFVWSEPS